MKLGHFWMLLCLTLLAACTTTPAPQPLPVKPQVTVIYPPEGMLRPCYLPPKKKPRDNRAEVNLYLDLRLAAEQCQSAIQELGDWYAKRKLDRP